MDIANLCQELVKAMEKQGFSEKSITTIKQSQHYTDAYDKGPDVQRTMLTMLFFNLTMYKEHPIPRNVRIGLNVATDSMAWLDDIVTVVLPFLRVNEDVFF